MGTACFNGLSHCCKLPVIIKSSGSGIQRLQREAQGCGIGVLIVC